MARNSKGGAVLYLMVHIPFIWWCKIGITHIGIGAFKRAMDLDKAMFGFPFPISFIYIPSAYTFEQKLHEINRMWNVRFYRGQGASEWFWFPAILTVFPFMFLVIVGYIYLTDMALGTHILPFVSGYIFWIICFLTRLFASL